MRALAAGDISAGAAAAATGCWGAWVVGFASGVQAAIEAMTTINASNLISFSRSSFTMPYHGAEDKTRPLKVDRTNSCILSVGVPTTRSDGDRDLIRFRGE
jgi:ABC-type transport system involved in cytochrome c biogenesis permease subunit